ncbi:hypothetical protein DY000_02009354 [Brassica cretica]|uniref:Uncharacterized protein n=1 Tax=Brassica cretica TaxID=69181 RepID=A0ABQ7CCQ2_BRACR|nr:hypothetical protein DY000_02009354 [Brassica cretica]
MIHPNPASSVEEFHAESVNTEYCPDHRGFGSGLIDGFGDFEIRGIDQQIHAAKPIGSNALSWGDTLELSSVSVRTSPIFSTFHSDESGRSRSESKGLESF